MSDESRAALLATKPSRDLFASDDEYKEALGYWMENQGRILGASRATRHDSDYGNSLAMVLRAPRSTRDWSDDDWDRHYDEKYERERRGFLKLWVYRLVVLTTVALLLFPPYLGKVPGSHAGAGRHFYLSAPPSASIDAVRLLVELLSVAMAGGLALVAVKRAKLERPRSWRIPDPWNPKGVRVMVGRHAARPGDEDKDSDTPTTTPF